MTTETIDTEVTGAELADSGMRVLKRDSCKSSSKKSEISYTISCNEKEELFFKVARNSGNGFTSQDYKSLRSIMALLEETPYPITGATLLPLYNRQSINTSYFLIVCLLNEGIVERWKRIYKLNDIKPFMTKMKALIASKDDVKTAPPKKKSQASSKKKPSKPVPSPL